MADRTIVTPYYLERPVPRPKELASADWSVNDPDFAAEGEQQRLASSHRPIADFVVAAVTAGDRPVSIAGDCCTAIGVMGGLQRAGVTPGLIWIDAHGDFNTPETTPSNFLGGMPLAMIVGLGDLTMPRAVGLEPFDAGRVLLSDGRDLDPGEADLLAASPVTVLAEFKELLEGPLPDGPIYVHFDSDVIDAAEAPAHNYPVGGGPSAAMVERVLSRLARTGRVIAASMSAWNPDLDTDGRTETLCMRSFAALLD